MINNVTNPYPEGQRALFPDNVLIEFTLTDILPKQAIINLKYQMPKSCVKSGQVNPSFNGKHLEISLSDVRDYSKHCKSPINKEDVTNFSKTLALPINYQKAYIVVASIQV